MTVLETLASQLEDRVVDLCNALCTGRIDHIEEYKRVSGEIYGLRTAIDMAKELQRKIDNAYDDDD